MRRVLFILAMLWGVALMPAGGQAGAQQMSPSEIAAAIGFSETDKQRALAGEVVAADLPETADTMLAQAIALVVPADTDTIAERLLSRRIFEVDSGVIASGRIDPAQPEAGLAGATFRAKDADEVAKIVKAGPGSDINLSSEEFAMIKAAAASGARSPEAVSKGYRSILAERVKA